MLPVALEAPSAAVRSEALRSVICSPAMRTPKAMPISTLLFMGVLVASVSPSELTIAPEGSSMDTGGSSTGSTPTIAPSALLAMVVRLWI